jgi:hypothetical protein
MLNQTHQLLIHKCQILIMHFNRVTHYPNLQHQRNTRGAFEELQRPKKGMRFKKCKP